MIKYIGLDAHSSTCTFNVTDERGREVDNTTIESNGRLLVKYVRGVEGVKKLTFEECELSNWLYEILRPEVDELIVCNPVANGDYKKKKTDKMDARKLSNLLRGGFLVPVYHDGSKRERLRSLMSGYQDFIEEGVRLKNRYKSLFRKSGKKIKGEALYNDESFLEGLERRDFQFIGTQIYQLLEKMEEGRQEYVKEIVRCSKGFKEIKYLKSIPGIGSIQAAKIVSQVIDPERFSSKYKYYSYCGLVRHKRISDGRGYGSEKIWGNRILKCVYKMAGHSVLKGKSGLRNYYDTLRLKGIGHDNAYNAVCRKIAAISLSVWRKSEKYNDRLITGNLIK
ncbi:MAG: transposase [Candidatus Brocadia sp.]|jgi:Transposase and inactivated derivatives|uniref:Transposase n=1 Tax=Candidatus Brocadia fulgida TaxID=380242 RepID=A0A0M2UW94_9BACT|nr:MAG: transposase [Candidatus Brocadia fulgida]UJS19193.1 MAG: transposase [Candidatus Brocadia sp.]UJS20793.1 MAG: transposase [Candidatus Brocadia sp.]UJS20870.1 MAG: transposase [Candidatus Brocadia sp.]UJS20928.1 MAG: transposase [Candidatus Brocadia sp.]